MPIIVRGAREHNLAAVDLDIPTGALVVFCGRSGSGKSSLAFDTLHAEGQRRYLQALGLSAEADLQPPNVDAILHLPPTLALGQRLAAPSSRHTLLDEADLSPALRLLFGRAGNAACPRCGRAVAPRTVDGIVADLLAEPKGSKVVIEAPVAATDGVLDDIVRAGFSRVRWSGEVTRVEDVGRIEPGGDLRIVVDRVKIGGDRRSRLADAVRLAGRAGRGVVVAWVEARERRWVDRWYCPHCDLALPALEPRTMSPRTRAGGCSSCAGAGCDTCAGSGLSPFARAARWRGAAWTDLADVPLTELHRRLSPAALDGSVSPLEAPALADARRRLEVLLELGLGDRTGAQRASTLASSELLRVRLARTVAGALGGVLYVLDEPAAGLDPDAAAAVVRQLRALVAGGSTVIAVEHHPAVIAAADHVVEFGPGAGADGGRIVFAGPAQALVTAPTWTGRWLAGDGRWPERPPRTRSRTVELAGYSLPHGAVTAFVGPSGAGKSRALAAVAEAARARPELGRVVHADRAAGRSSRSMPATFVGLWDVLRGLFAQTKEAQVRGLDASAFSLQSRGGRCEACKGAGQLAVAMDALPDVWIPCPTCDGRRFTADVLEVRWKGMDPSEILSADAATLRPLLAGHPKLEAGLGALTRVGLGYVPLGQGTDTLSGGEARRLALARELAGGRLDALYVLDDPTVGLHPADSADLLGLLHELADLGGTVILATHDAPFAARCDHRVEPRPQPSPSL